MLLPIPKIKLSSQILGGHFSWKYSLHIHKYKDHAFTDTKNEALFQNSWWPFFMEIFFFTLKINLADEGGV